MKESPVFRDEDLSHKWGPSGNTAKLASVHWCSDNGYYDTKINDKGEWKFSASCSGTVPDGWSKRYTNESAQLLGYPSARDAAKQDCNKKAIWMLQTKKIWVDIGIIHLSVLTLNGIYLIQVKIRPVIN